MDGATICPRALPRVPVLATQECGSCVPPPSPLHPQSPRAQQLDPSQGFSLPLQGPGAPSTPHLCSHTSGQGAPSCQLMPRWMPSPRHP